MWNDGRLCLCVRLCFKDKTSKRDKVPQRQMHETGESSPSTTHAQVPDGRGDAMNPDLRTDNRRDRHSPTCFTPVARDTLRRDGEEKKKGGSRLCVQFECLGVARNGGRGG